MSTPPTHPILPLVPPRRSTPTAPWLRAALVMAVVLPLARPWGAGAQTGATGAQAGPSSPAEAPVALVVRVQGDVRLERGGSSTTAAVGQRLMAGDRLVPGPSARALLVVRSGAQQLVSAPMTLTAPTTTEPADLFARAVATLAQAAALDATLGGRQGMIRPIPGRTSLLTPVNGLTVLPRRPSFRWTATPGARYELMLRRIEGGRPEIFDVGLDTVWVLPPAAAELVPGAMYAWTVFVGGREGGRPVPQQEFRVASDDEQAAVDARMDAIRDLGLDPTGDGRVLAAIALRQLELFPAARDVLDALLLDGGAMSGDLHRLHGEVLAELGDAQGARRAFDRAVGAAP